MSPCCLFLTMVCWRSLGCCSEGTILVVPTLKEQCSPGDPLHVPGIRGRHWWQKKNGSLPMGILRPQKFIPISQNFQEEIVDGFISEFPSLFRIHQSTILYFVTVYVYLFTLNYYMPLTVQGLQLFRQDPLDPFHIFLPPRAVKCQGPTVHFLAASLHPALAISVHVQLTLQSESNLHAVGHAKEW